MDKTIISIKKGELDMSLHENWTDVNQKELFKSLLSQPRTTRNISKDTVQKIKKLMDYAYYLKMSDKKDYRIAEKEFERILRLYKDNAEACYRYGFIQYRKENWTKAVYYFDQAYKLNTTQTLFPLTESQYIKAPFFKGYCAAQIVKEVQEEMTYIDEEDKELQAEGISVNNLIEQFTNEIQNYKYTLETDQGEFEYLDDVAYEDIIFGSNFELLLNYAERGLYAKYHQQQIELSIDQMYFLESLLTARGTIVTRHDLDGEMTWDKYRQKIKRLKDKFEGHNLNLPIVNVRGEEGYRLQNMTFGIIRTDA